MSYEFLEHTADVKFRAEGASLEEMFVSAAEAMAETVRGDIKILEQEDRSFEVEGKDDVGLLYNFLVGSFCFCWYAEVFFGCGVLSL